MNDIAEQRPSFFEGEVLSASDLEQLVVYLRDQSARHMLGGHTWGIVAGLRLFEQESPAGTLDVYLLPGYAVDGYGRAIVVVNPLRLGVDWFNGQPSGPVQVWIRYDQDQTNAVRPGFQVCCDGNDAYSRVAESYAIEVGNLSLAKQQSGISMAGEAVADARQAPRLFDDNGSLICDGSVPYQDLPLADEKKSRWLIPLGEVGWQAGTPGKFVTLVDPANPSKVIHSRRLRHYIGVVAENVYAADGLLRLRRRTTEVAGLVDQTAVDAACAAGDLTDASHDDDLENCAEGPTPTELVWVEGRLRVTDDVRVLSPGRIELRDASGTSYHPTTAKGSVPTFLQRTDHVTGTSNNADLAIVIGKADPDTTSNRLLIQQASEPEEPLPCQAVQFKTLTTKVAVLDKGFVGIGTEDPDQLLEIENGGDAFIHLENTAVPSELYLGAGEFGGVLATTGTNDLRIRTGVSDPTDDTKTRMTIVSTGEVGIGTTNPDTDRNVTIEGQETAYLIARTVDGPHEVLLGANGDGALLTANTAGDDLILGANAGDAFVWIKANGRVGINHDAPGHDLSVKGASEATVAIIADQGIDRRMVLGADSSGVFAGSRSDHDFQLRTDDTNRVMIKANGRVGIDTDAPTQQLDVRGNIVLGSTGQYFAPGGYQNWAVIAGNVGEDGTFTAGNGYTVSHSSGSDDYRIDFTSPFSASPVVTVQLLGLPGIGGVPAPVVHNTSGNGFNVRMVSGPNEYTFGFIALVER
jgi:hypothetical protein